MDDTTPPKGAMTDHQEDTLMETMATTLPTPSPPSTAMSRKHMSRPRSTASSESGLTSVRREEGTPISSGAPHSQDQSEMDDSKPDEPLPVPVPTPTPPPANVSSTRPSRKNGQKQQTRKPPILYNHLPSALAEATSQFTVITDCIYASKNMGNSDNEVLDCDCRPERVNGVNLSCAEEDCINRATKCECVIGSAICGDDCQNQRFQRKQYANVDVIKTEKKGYGLRANESLFAHQFIFEYIGDVINEPTFRRRMHKYDEEGIKHFYFMSLTRSEFVDATRKGNLGRFCNHSCNPNCYVDKWAVGNKLRMGIFALRDIQAGEELVFNYNVDRYGAQPQVCYCGEDNCVGFIGGKTQTQTQTRLNHDVVEALGLDDAVDTWEPAVAKKQRKKISDDDEPYLPGIGAKDLDDNSIKRIMTVLIQTSEKWLVIKLLERIKACQEERLLNMAVRMHAYQTMKKLLNAYKDEDAVVLLILHVLDKFPRITNNKIEGSKIKEPVKAFVTSENAEVSAAAQHILEEWSKLKAGYRITKRANGETYDQDSIYGRSRTNDSPASNSTENERRPPSPIINAPTGPKNSVPQRNPNFPRGMNARRMPFHNQAATSAVTSQPVNHVPNHPLPEGWRAAKSESGIYYWNEAGETTWTLPTSDFSASAPTPAPAPVKAPTKQEILAKIISDVNAEPRKRTESPATSTPQRNDASDRESRKAVSDEAWRALPLRTQKIEYEIQLSKHVIKFSKKFQNDFDRSDLKELSKQVCKSIVESDFKHNRVQNPKTPLSESNLIKMKKYVYDFFKKALAKKRIREQERQARGRQANTSSSTPVVHHHDQSLLSAPNSVPDSTPTGTALNDTPITEHSSPGSDGRNKRKRGGGDLESTTEGLADVASVSSKRPRDEPVIDITSMLQAIATKYGAQGEPSNS